MKTQALSGKIAALFILASDVVIIAISASVLEADREKSPSAGCNVFLSKPIGEERLLDLLATHLG